jgi:hypothetical protein
MTPEQFTEIERSGRNRPTAVYLYDRKRGLMNATTDVLALIEELRRSLKLCGLLRTPTLLLRRCRWL